MHLQKESDQINDENHWRLCVLIVIVIDAATTYSGSASNAVPAIRLMHESAIGGHDQWLPRCRSNIGIGNEIVGSFLSVLNSMALYSIWNMLCNLISE